MLSTLTRKLCPMMSLAVVTVGCGKKIIDNDTKTAHQIQNQTLPSAYVLRLDGSEGSSKQYPMPENAQFKVPTQLKVRAGNPQGKTVEVAFDVNEYDEDNFQFKCNYSASSNPSEMKLDYCAFDDHDMGDISDQTFSLYKDDTIRLKFIGASASDLVVDMIFSMKWL